MLVGQFNLISKLTAHHWKFETGERKFPVVGTYLCALCGRRRQYNMRVRHCSDVLFNMLKDNKLFMKTTPLKKVKWWTIICCHPSPYYRRRWAPIFIASTTYLTSLKSVSFYNFVFCKNTIVFCGFSDLRGSVTCFILKYTWIYCVNRLWNFKLKTINKSV